MTVKHQITLYYIITKLYSLLLSFLSLVKHIDRLLIFYVNYDIIIQTLKKGDIFMFKKAWKTFQPTLFGSIIGLVIALIISILAKNISIFVIVLIGSIIGLVCSFAYSIYTASKNNK